MSFRFIIFLFLSSSLALNTFGAVNSEETRFPASDFSENEELVAEFENALLDPNDKTLAFNQTKTASKTANVGNTISSDELAKIEKIDEGIRNSYLSFNGGVLNFPSVGNVQTLNGAGGFSLGTSLSPQFKIEAGFIYSFHQTEINQYYYETLFEDIDQYSFNATGVYHWNVPWPVQPITGVTAGWTRRQYNYDENSSNAFDVGLVLGFDKPINSGFSLGLEYRYMINISYEREFESSDYNMEFQRLAMDSTEIRDLESFNYQVVFLNAKLRF